MRAVQAVAVTLTTVMTAAAPCAYAVAPKPIDRGQLPAPAAPTPPGRTEQSDRCSTAKPADDRPAHQLDMLDIAAVWPLSRGNGQTVAVIDTGVGRHRLLPHLVAGGDYVSSGDGTQDCDGHGTAIAGLIGATAASTAPGASMAWPPTPPSWRFVSPATNSDSLTTMRYPALAMSRRSPARSVRPPTRVPL